MAHLLGDLESVRAHQNRDTALAHAPEHVFDQSRAARIQSHHRFVHGRLPMMEKAHHQALLHPVGEAFDQLVLPLAQLEEIEHLVRARRRCHYQIHATRVERQELTGRELVVDERPIGMKPSALRLPDRVRDRGCRQGCGPTSV